MFFFCIGLATILIAFWCIRYMELFPLDAGGSRVNILEYLTSQTSQKIWNDLWNGKTEYGWFIFLLFMLHINLTFFFRPSLASLLWTSEKWVIHQEKRKKQEPRVRAWEGVQMVAMGGFIPICYMFAFFGLFGILVQGDDFGETSEFLMLAFYVLAPTYHAYKFKMEGKNRSLQSHSS